MKGPRMVSILEEDVVEGLWKRYPSRTTEHQAMTERWPTKLPRPLPPLLNSVACLQSTNLSDKKESRQFNCRYD